MIIGLDPGKENFAFALLENEKVLEVGWVSPLRDIQFEPFADLFVELMVKVKPEALILERFMIRGGKGGGGAAKSAEYVNWMLGSIGTLCAHVVKVPYYFITASQWKRYIKKHVPPDFSNITENEHQLDACHIAWYAETYWIPKKNLPKSK